MSRKRKYRRRTATTGGTPPSPPQQQVKLPSRSKPRQGHRDRAALPKGEDRDKPTDRPDAGGRLLPDRYAMPWFNLILFESGAARGRPPPAMAVPADRRRGSGASSGAAAAQRPALTQPGLGRPARRLPSRPSRSPPHRRTARLSSAPCPHGSSLVAHPTTTTTAFPPPPPSAAPCFGVSTAAAQPGETLPLISG